MTPAEARDVLSAMVKTAWDSAASGAALLYDNDREQHPPKDASLWGRLHIQHDVGDRVTIGDGEAALFRDKGRLSVQLFAPPRFGTLAVETLAGDLLIALRAANPAGIRIHRVLVKDVGPDGTFYQMNVELAFQYDTQGS